MLTAILSIALHAAYPLGFEPRCGAFSIVNAPRGQHRQVLEALDLSSGQRLGAITEKVLQERVAKKFPRQAKMGAGIVVTLERNPKSIFRDITVTFPK